MLFRSTKTTEAGGKVTFTVKLDSEPLANVTIPISSNDLTEGTVSPATLTFTAANWNTAQTVTVTGVDDTLTDGDIAYSVIIGAATSTDALYNGKDPADIALTNIDNETKFYVVDDASSTDRTYEYNATGGSIEDYGLNSANTASRGIAATAAMSNIRVGSVMDMSSGWNCGPTRCALPRGRRWRPTRALPRPRHGHQAWTA